MGCRAIRYIIYHFRQQTVRKMIALSFKESNGKFGMIDASNPSDMDHMLLRVVMVKTVAEFMKARR